jgi:hypothetical protein
VTWRMDGIPVRGSIVDLQSRNFEMICQQNQASGLEFVPEVFNFRQYRIPMHAICGS